MGELKNKMVMKMELKNFSKRTMEVYLFQMKKLVKYYGKSPDLLGEAEVEKYLHSFYATHLTGELLQDKILRNTEQPEQTKKHSEVPWAIRSREE